MFLYLIMFLWLQGVLLSILFLFQIATPFFMKANSLYSPLSIHLSLLPFQFLGNPLDACPIKALLEVIRRAMSKDDTGQVLFLHKCDQISWCSAFNVVMAVSFLDISSFHCWYGSATSPEAHLSKMVNFLKYSLELALILENLSCFVNFLFSLWHSDLGLHGHFNHP